jgi:hypothetical protein
MRHRVSGRRERKIRERVPPEVFLQAWFLPRSLAFQVHRLLPKEYREKMRHYFDDYGCLRCNSRSAYYGACGLCRACYKKVLYQLASVLKRRNTAKKDKEQYTELALQRAALAKRLLKDLRTG